MDIYFLRHAEAETTVRGVCAGQGTACSGLTEYGQVQLEHIRAVLPSLSLNKVQIYTSPLLRTCQTAHMLGHYYKSSEIVQPGLRERDYGDWEGVSFESVRDDLSAGVTPPGGESHYAFCQRVQATLHSILIGMHENASPWIVSHGGVWQALHDHAGIDAPWIHPGDIYRIDGASFGGGVLKIEAVFISR